MKSAIPTKFIENGALWEGQHFGGENLENSWISIVLASCGQLFCFTSCLCGNQVDGSPHVVNQKETLDYIFYSKSMTRRASSVLVKSNAEAVLSQ